MAVKDDLLSIERVLWSGDAEAYRRNLDDECLIAFQEMGGRMTRDEVAGTVEGGDRWRDLEIEVEGVIQPTPELAILTYRVNAVRGDGEGETYRARVSSGYVNRDGQWKMAFHQQTPLAGP